MAVLAIILTTLMFTTLFVLSQSMSRNIIEMTFRQTGYDGQASFKSITEEQAAKIAAHPDVAETGYSMVVGIGQGKELSGRQVEIRFADESYAEHSFAKPVTGRMPQAADEIALDNIVLDKLGIPHELGQRVTLEWIADFQEEENRVSEFTLCGFWEGMNLPMRVWPGVSREFAEDVTAQLDAADEIFEDRMRSWNLYYELLKPLEEKGKIALPHIPENCMHNAHMFYIKAKDLQERSALISYLKENKIQSVFHYIPLHSAPAGERFGRFHGEDVYTTRESERLARLPMFYGLKEDQVRYIAEKVSEFYR